MCLGKLGLSTLDNAKSIRFQTEGEASIINHGKYPYKPDLLFAHRNETIVRYVIIKF